MIKGKTLYRQFVWEEYIKDNISQEEAIARIQEYEDAKKAHTRSGVVLSENFT